MKRPLFLSLICFSMLTLTMPLCLAQQPEKPLLPVRAAKPSKPALPKASGLKSPSKYSLNILELTNAQTYRYGRERYLTGHYTEAAKAFLDILRHDCGNKLAQYHLRKIAAKDPSLAFLNEKLDKLPCKAYDFTREEFLPASVYYEKDPDLVLEQMISYNTRHRLTEKEMTEKIDQYTIMVQELETTVNMLKQKPVVKEAVVSEGAIDPKTLERLEEGTRSANKIEKEISLLKNQMASERINGQKEVQDLRTGLAEAEARILTEQETAKKAAATLTPAASPVTEQTPTSPVEENYTDSAKALMDAVAQAKIELEGKERRLAEKDQAITTLQARFDDIQRRLKTIQTDLARKNAEIQAIQNNLQDTPKP